MIPGYDEKCKLEIEEMSRRRWAVVAPVDLFSSNNN